VPRLNGILPQPGGTAMDLEELLSRLEDVVERGERFWHLFGGRSVVKADEVYDLLQTIRANIPEEVRTVQQATRDRERLIQEAHDERAKIIEAAREQAELLLSHDQQVVEAKRRAEQVLEEARIEADGIRADAERYARQVIEKLATYIQRIQATVDKTRGMLRTEGEREQTADAH